MCSNMDSINLLGFPWCNFMLDQTTLSSAMHFSVFFDGYIVAISMDRSTFSSRRFGHFRPSSVLVCARSNTEDGLKWPKCVDENVRSCPYLL